MYTDNDKDLRFAFELAENVNLKWNLYVQHYFFSPFIHSFAHSDSLAMLFLLVVCCLHHKRNRVTLESTYFKNASDSSLNRRWEIYKRRRDQEWVGWGWENENRKKEIQYFAIQIRQNVMSLSKESNVCQTVAGLLRLTASTSTPIISASVSV